MDFVAPRPLQSLAKKKELFGSNHPALASVLNKLAQLYRQMGKKEEAQQYFERALQELLLAEELTGGDPVVSEHLGDVYFSMNPSSGRRSSARTM